MALEGVNREDVEGEADNADRCHVSHGQVGVGIDVSDDVQRRL